MTTNVSVLKLCTFNIFNWRTRSFTSNVIPLAKLCKRLNFDIIGLNEVVQPCEEWWQYLSLLSSMLQEDDETSIRVGETSNAYSSLLKENEGQIHVEKYTKQSVKGVSNLAYYAGACSRAKMMQVSNALIVNLSPGCSFSRRLMDFQNHELRPDVGMARGAAQVTLIHPIIGAMNVYSTHLDHMKEPIRLAQLDMLMQKVDQSLPHIIMGDFNALTKSDYSLDYEAEITQVRDSGRWELPKYELTEKMAELGYVDVWKKLNPNIFDEGVTTCTYFTRIDYIFVSASMAEFVDWEHAKTCCLILDNVDASDHYPVAAEMVIRQPTKDSSSAAVVSSSNSPNDSQSIESSNY